VCFNQWPHYILSKKVCFPKVKHSSEFWKEGLEEQKNACLQWVGHPCYMGTKSYSCNADYLGHTPWASKYKKLQYFRLA
jgi:hypothetical protein